MVAGGSSRGGSLMSMVRDVAWFLAVVQSWWYPYDHGIWQCQARWWSYSRGGRPMCMVREMAWLVAVVLSWW